MTSMCVWHAVRTRLRDSIGMLLDKRRHCVLQLFKGQAHLVTKLVRKRTLQPHSGRREWRPLQKGRRLRLAANAALCARYVPASGTTLSQCTGHTSMVLVARPVSSKVEPSNIQHSRVNASVCNCEARLYGIKSLTRRLAAAATGCGPQCPRRPGPAAPHGPAPAAPRPPSAAAPSPCSTMQRAIDHHVHTNLNQTARRGCGRASV